MTVRAFYFRGRRFAVSGEGYDNKGEIRLEGDASDQNNLTPLLVPLVLCNDSQVTDGQVIGDPTEAALLVLGAKGGVDREALIHQYPRIAEIPFDAAHKFMATFHRDGEIVRVYVKGAPELLLPQCARQLTSEGETGLTAAVKSKIGDEYRALAERGLRGLLVATRSFPLGDSTKRAT